MAFVMVLSYSRRVFVRFFLNSRSGAFLQGHVDAFAQWQSCARVLLYDNLKSAVLSRQGQAIEFNPALLELAAHYRFEPRAAAVARGNEKGRVERAIRYLRDNFFAGRQWTDLDELNEQALAWSLGAAMDRPWPQDRRRTVREAFGEEQSQLLALPDHPFVAEEALAVSVGKTPYVRFDLNDYSLPPKYVRSNLTVRASEQQVRVLDQGQVVAQHRRHYGKAEQIIDPAHSEALRQRKHQAKSHSGQHRLLAACAATEDLLKRSVDRGHRLATTIRLLLEALDDYGSEAFNQAVAQALQADTPHANAVTQLLQCEREQQQQPPPLSIKVNDPKAQIQIKPASLDHYKQLTASDRDITEEAEEPIHD